MPIVDLTHTLDRDMPVFPGTPQPSFEPKHTIDANGFSQLEIRTYSHMGTHIDAPFHMLGDGKTLDELPIDQFIGTATILPLHQLKGKEIRIEHLEKYEEQIKMVDFLLFDLGWRSYWGQDSFFHNFPCLTLEAAQWLTKWDLKGIGMDSCSVDPIDAEVFEIHHTILGAEMLIIENLTHLEKVKPEFFQFQCFPLKIKRADGCPVRAVAVW